jgi:hypothetical protein
VIYPSIRHRGVGILSPDLIWNGSRNSPARSPSDFGFDSSGTKVKDEIARAWADAQDYWRIFQRKLEVAQGPDSPATTETRQQWMVPLLGLLGYQLEFQQAKGTQLNEKNYAISHRVDHRACPCPDRRLPRPCRSRPQARQRHSPHVRARSRAGVPEPDARTTLRPGDQRAQCCACSATARGSSSSRTSNSTSTAS